MTSLSTNQALEIPRRVTVKIVEPSSKAKYTRQFYSWTTLQEIKKYVEKKTGIPPKKQRLFQHQTELLARDTALEDLGSLL